ncbi:2-oxoglutarate dehydrogenase complex dihydrolipoyllysine-residue succinyltransferase [bacterium]|nr:2-oxoglutarate dehydrogenase complex dihydrolipoyllysine-residue succinyltransferase [bacterium]
MALELKVPEIGESITEVIIAKWLKSVGEAVALDESLVEIESDKATIELPSPIAGTLTQILKQDGEQANVGDLIGYMEESAQSGQTAKVAEEPSPAAQPAATAEAGGIAVKRDEAATLVEQQEDGGGSGEPLRVMPAAKRALADANLSAEEVQPSGPGGRLLKEDVLRVVEQIPQESAGANAPAALPALSEGTEAREEEAVPMTPMRLRIAERLVEAQQTAALLTTFNEIDMSAVIALRKQYKDVFKERYGIKLGFMSFFIKAAVDSLKQFPQVNAEIRGSEIVYKNYYDIGIAIGGGKGLVVPVLRSAERMSFAEIELAIDDFAQRAQVNRIDLKELAGGTFTISNGGIYGSLLSTPIVNPPQSAILGMHVIQERPVARQGQVVVRPMMYVAVTYDHRVIDGRESVAFLRRIKDAVEEPSRMLLEI